MVLACLGRSVRAPAGGSGRVWNVMPDHVKAGTVELAIGGEGPRGGWPWALIRVMVMAG
jgi:hypothetical protein